MEPERGQGKYSFSKKSKKNATNSKGKNDTGQEKQEMFTGYGCPIPISPTEPSKLFIVEDPNESILAPCDLSLALHYWLIACLLCQATYC